MDRSAIMARVKRRDTKPEMIVRRALREIGFTGYRLDRGELPGRPDIAFIGKRRAIFVHGCFWHGHDCKRGARQPKTNVEYWRAKIARNQTRDAAALDALAALGWRALVIWECELKRDDLKERLRAFLTEDGARQT